jgi:hypothetical protein
LPISNEIQPLSPGPVNGEEAKSKRISTGLENVELAADAEDVRRFLLPQAVKNVY